MMYMCICAFKNLFTHELVLNSTQLNSSFHFFPVAPVIISPPRDSYGPLGANLTLDCEARGYPAPEISWRFVSAKGETLTLPSEMFNACNV